MNKIDFAKYCSRAWAMGKNGVNKDELDIKLNEWIGEIKWK